MDLDAGDLVRAVPALGAVAEIRASRFGGSARRTCRLRTSSLCRPASAKLAGEGVQGVVVTQGTDTLEETAFLLDRLVEPDLPVVVTGAMRNSGIAGADGPANLLAAVRVAVSPAAKGVGTLVAMNDEIHLARFVRKGHATSLATFESPPLGPVGWIAEGRVRIPLVPRRRLRRFALTTARDVPQVALVTVSFDDSPRLIELIEADRFGGAVVETYGAGHISQRALDALAALSSRMPTVFASRTGVGELHTSSCDFGGSELRLLERGLISLGRPGWPQGAPVAWPAPRGWRRSIRNPLRIPGIGRIGKGRRSELAGLAFSRRHLAYDPKCSVSASIAIRMECRQHGARLAGME